MRVSGCLLHCKSRGWGHSLFFLASPTGFSTVSITQQELNRLTGTEKCYYSLTLNIT